MAKTYLEINTVNHSFGNSGYENVSAELNRGLDYHRQKVLQLAPLEESADEETKVEFAKEVGKHRSQLEQIRHNQELLEKYPDEFPVLYTMRNRTFDDEAAFEFREILNEESEIVTEAQDVLPKDERLEMLCTSNGTGSFGISVEPYNRAGEEKVQLKARINFSQKALEDLNAERLKRILEFCEKRGLSVYDIDLPMKDGVIDVDEKLAALTRRIMEERRKESEQQNPPAIEDLTEKDFNILDARATEAPVADLGIQPPERTAKGRKKEKSLADVRNDLVKMLEEGLHKTGELTYFERMKRINGLTTYVFSLYDKPDRKNLEKDGVKDKNGVHVPTYAYRLYVSQDSKTGRFVFGYATPGGKKMDDGMAGEYLGVIKDAGITHLNFSNLPNADKGVWLMACAEKGIVPIGISINMAKAKAMVKAAGDKLSTEEFNRFKRSLGAQIIENAQKKKPDDKYFGLPKSEYDFALGLGNDYEFSNFKTAYENSLYPTVLQKIEDGANDKKEGAATTFGAMSTLRDVFDIYMKYQHENFGRFLQESTTGRRPLEKAELDALKTIPADKPFTELNPDEFMLIYNTLLPRRTKDAKQDILEAYKREQRRKPQRADAVVLSSDLFPKVKAEVNGINVILRREGIDNLTLPVEHSGLEFARPDWLQSAQQNQSTPQQSTANTNTGRNSGNNR